MIPRDRVLDKLDSFLKSNDYESATRLLNYWLSEDEYTSDNHGKLLIANELMGLTRKLGLNGKQCKNEKYHSYKGEVGKVADNYLNRDFKADKPFEKLTTDVTEFKVDDEKVCLSPVMDLFNREIISYSISTSPNLWQIREMLAGLFDKLPADATPLFYSD